MILEDCPDELVESIDQSCIRNREEVGLGSDKSDVQTTFEIHLPVWGTGGLVTNVRLQPWMHLPRDIQSFTASTE